MKPGVWMRYFNTKRELPKACYNVDSSDDEASEMEDSSNKGGKTDSSDDEASKSKMDSSDEEASKMDSSDLLSVAHQRARVRLVVINNNDDIQQVKRLLIQLWKSNLTTSGGVHYALLTLASPNP